MSIKYNVVIDQGADFSTTIILREANGAFTNLTGMIGASQFRKTYTASKFYTINVDFGARANGELILSMSANATNNVPAGRYVYDCELTDSGGKKIRAVEGIVTVTPQVTR